MANEYGIPSTIDTVVLSTSLAEYRKTLTDNIYNDVVVLNLSNRAGNVRRINGGLSIG